MFLLGVNVDQASATAFFVIIEKTLKNVRHYYAFKKARQAPAATCRNDIIAFYNDTAYTIRKRIFSQDRRPKKDVSARPTIVMAAGQDDPPLIDSLRRSDVPVEAVYLCGDREESPRPAPGRVGIGKDHSASEQMIYETLARVSAQQRLMPLVDSGNNDHLLESLGRMLEDPLNSDPLLLAAATPIWFRENVRYTSAYRTSSTSIRRFK